MSALRDSTYRELLVADQRRRAVLSRRRVIRTYVAISGVCFLLYITLTNYYSRRLNKAFVVTIDGVDITVVEDYLASFTTTVSPPYGNGNDSSSHNDDGNHNGSGSGLFSSYFFAMVLWRLIPSLSLLVGIGASAFAVYAYLYPEEVERGMVTYFSPRDVKEIHNASRGAALANEDRSSSSSSTGKNNKVYDEARLSQLSEERFKKASSSPSLLSVASPSSGGGGNSLWRRLFFAGTTTSAGGADNSNNNNSCIVNKSIATQEDLNRFMEMEQRRLAEERSIFLNSDNAGNASHNNGGNGALSFLSGASSGAGGNAAAMLLAGDMMSPTARSGGGGGGGIFSSLFGGSASNNNNGGPSSSSGNGISVMFGFGSNNNNRNGLSSSSASSLSVLNGGGLLDNSALQNNNVTALLGGSDVRQRLLMFQQQQQMQSSAHQGSSNLLLSGVFGSGGMMTSSSSSIPAPISLTPKQLRMLQVWQALQISDIASSVAAAKRWVGGILTDLMKDINRCNKELAGRCMHDMDCNHSLAMLRTLTTASATAGGVGAVAAPATTNGFGAAPAAGGFGAAAAPAAGGFGGTATAGGGFGGGAFGAPKPGGFGSGGGFGAASTSTGFGSPAAGIVPSNVPLTKGQQLLNDKALMSQKAPTAESMDLIELINLRLGLEKAIDAANSIVFRAARNASNNSSSATTTTTATAAAPAAGGFGGFGGATAGATAGGFGAPKPGGFGASSGGGFGAAPAAPAATTGGFGAPPAATAAGGFGAKPLTTTTAAATTTTAAAASADKTNLASPQERQYHRPYIIHRLEAFTAHRGLSAFVNDGADIAGWNEALPLDAHLILHILQIRCPNVFGGNAVKLAHTPEHSSTVVNSSGSFRLGSSSNKSSSSSSYSRAGAPIIHVGSVGEPYFFVENPTAASSASAAGGSSRAFLSSYASNNVFGSDDSDNANLGAASAFAASILLQQRFLHTLQTPDSLFEAIVLCAALMKKAKPVDAQMPEGFYNIVV